MQRRTCFLSKNVQMKEIKVVSVGRETDAISACVEVFLHVHA